jgi:hypothetical protein
MCPWTYSSSTPSKYSSSSPASFISNVVKLKGNTSPQQAGCPSLLEAAAALDAARVEVLSPLVEAHGDDGLLTGGGSSSPSPPPVSLSPTLSVPGTFSSSSLLSPAVEEPFSRDVGCYMIRPKCIYFPEHFCYCFSSNSCVLNTTNTD